MTSMALTRVYHTATLLTNGKILVAGGNGDNNTAITDSVVLFDPTTNSWSAAASLTYARTGHSATLLPNGKVLVVGGLQGSDTMLNNAELYDPVTNTWTSAGTMQGRRSFHTATLLKNGRVLIVGGDSYNTLFAQTEIYDPASNSWSLGTNLNTLRGHHTATLLPDGQVLVVGGDISQRRSFSSAEIYNPTTDVWRNVASMSVSRADHTATLLPNGKVLIAGGISSETGNALYAATLLKSTEIYTPSTDSWVDGPNLAAGRQLHTATLLANGDVLVVGGGGNSGSSNVFRQIHGGGYNGTIYTVEYYSPTSNTWTTVSNTPISLEAHAATLLSNGRVIVTGGWYATPAAEGGGSYYLSSVFQYIPNETKPASVINLCPTTLQAGAQDYCSSKVTYSDGSSKVVTPSWSSSKPTVLSIDNSSGLLGAKSVTTTTSVNITSSYTESGTTVTAVNAVTVTPATSTTTPSTLTATCPTTLSSGAQGNCSAKVTYSDGTSKTVVASWLSSASTAVTVDSSSGKLTAKTVASTVAAVISASYTEAGVTLSATASVSIQSSTGSTSSKVPATLALACPESLKAAAKDSCVATVTYTDGTTKVVTPSWLSSAATVLTIDSAGQLTAKSVTVKSGAVISASYTENNGTVTASATVYVTVSAVSLSKLTLACGASVISGSKVGCAATASYADGTQKIVRPQAWSLNVSDALTVNEGLVTALTVKRVTPVVITANFSEGGVLVSGSATITVMPNLNAGASPAVECLFGWAERTYDGFFPNPNNDITTTVSSPYILRYYSLSKSYLAFDKTSAHVLYLGPLSAGRVLDLGDFNLIWATASGCADLSI